MRAKYNEVIILALDKEKQEKIALPEIENDVILAYKVNIKMVIFANSEKYHHQTYGIKHLQISVARMFLRSFITTHC